MNDPNPFVFPTVESLASKSPEQLRTYAVALGLGKGRPEPDVLIRRIIDYLGVIHHSKVPVTRPQHGGWVTGPSRQRIPAEIIQTIAKECWSSKDVAALESTCKDARAALHSAENVWRVLAQRHLVDTRRSEIFSWRHTMMRLKTRSWPSIFV
jgi:hypothetical protein